MAEASGDTWIKADEDIYVKSSIYVTQQTDNNNITDFSLVPEHDIVPIVKEIVKEIVNEIDKSCNSPTLITENESSPQTSRSRYIDNDSCNIISNKDANCDHISDSLYEDMFNPIAILPFDENIMELDNIPPVAKDGNIDLQFIASSQEIDESCPITSAPIIKPKTRPMTNDIDENNFVNKNSVARGKAAQLKIEQVTTDIYAKKSGFLTERPIEWALALERILEHTHIDHRWDYTCEDNLFSECIIKLLSTKSKKLTIEMKLATGVILISGTDHRDWIAGFFEPWGKTVESGEYNPKSSEIIKNLSPTITNKKEDDSKELASLWDEHTILKTSMTNLANHKFVRSMRRFVKSLRS